MSLLLKSELRLRLGPHRCEARIRPAGWRARETAALAVEAPQGHPLISALDALESRGLRLPERARIMAEDEFLYFAHVPDPGQGNASKARLAAQRHFDAALGTGNWSTEVSLNATGDAWLAVALPSEVHAEWASLLAERGIDLIGIGAAAFDDLHRLQHRIPTGPGLAVLVRSEGVIFAGLGSRGVQRLRWERCETDQANMLAARIQAALDRIAATAGGGLSRVLPTATIAPLRPDQQALCESLATGKGWQVLPAVSDAPLAVPAQTSHERASAG